MQEERGIFEHFLNPYFVNELQEKDESNKK